jgi:hypothetical protein
MAKTYRADRAPRCASASLLALDLLRRVDQAGIDLTVPLPRAVPDATPPFTGKPGPSRDGSPAGPGVRSGLYVVRAAAPSAASPARPWSSPFGARL